MLVKGAEWQPWRWMSLYSATASPGVFSGVSPPGIIPVQDRSQVPTSSHLLLSVLAGTPMAKHDFSSHPRLGCCWLGQAGAGSAPGHFAVSYSSLCRRELSAPTADPQPSSALLPSWAGEGGEWMHPVGAPFLSAFFWCLSQSWPQVLQCRLIVSSLVLSFTSL